MKLKTLATAVLAVAAIGLIAADEKPAKVAPEKPAYDKSKDLDTPAPEGADILFDGTQESIDKN